MLLFVLVYGYSHFVDYWVLSRIFGDKRMKATNSWDEFLSVFFYINKAYYYTNILCKYNAFCTLICSPYHYMGQNLVYWIFIKLVEGLMLLLRGCKSCPTELVEQNNKEENGCKNFTSGI